MATVHIQYVDRPAPVPVNLQNVEGYNQNASKLLGVALMVAGGLTIALQIPATILVNSHIQVVGWWNVTGIGITAGGLILINGCFAFGAYVTPMRCRVMTTLVLAIVSMPICVILIVYMALSIEEGVISRSANCVSHGSDCEELLLPCHHPVNCERQTAVIVLNSIIIVVAVFTIVCDGITTYICQPVCQKPDYNTNYPTVVHIPEQQVSYINQPNPGPAQPSIHGGKGTAPQTEPPSYWQVN